MEKFEREREREKESERYREKQSARERERNHNKVLHDGVSSKYEAIKTQTCT
jgi:hypothetical protein